MNRKTAKAQSTVSRTLRLPAQVQEALRTTALREGRSENAVTIDAIERYTSERTRRRDEAVDRIVTEDAELLDHLGK